ncbi:MAG: hydroxyacid dehydrogenase [Planctomycetota bacterium]
MSQTSRIGKAPGLCVMNSGALDQVFGPGQRRELQALLDEVEPPCSAESLRSCPEWLREARVVVTGWGGPRFDEDLLAHAPELEVVLHAAGSIRPIVSDAFWDRGIRISSAAAANATPVAEFCLAQIFMLMKNFYAVQRMYHDARAKPPSLRLGLSPGAYRQRVGLVSFGQIARQLREMLRPHELEVVVYDPYLDEHQAREAEVVRVSLEEVFATSQVVSIHTPSVPETHGLIHKQLILSLPEHAGLLNTARGAVVDELGIIQALHDRPDLTAVLDVTEPEPPLRSSPLWTMPNVVLTPHIAGSIGVECRRLGQQVIDELRRFNRGLPLQHAVTRESARLMA